MSFDRLTRALDQGLFDIDPAASITVFNAPAGFVEFSRAHKNLTALTPYFTHKSALERDGIKSVTTADVATDIAIVSVHRSKEANLWYLSQALKLTRPGGQVIVDGSKTDGVDTIYKTLRKLFDPIEAFSKAHGRLISFRCPENLPDIAHWQDPARNAGAFQTHVGNFSADKIDRGSQMLAQHLGKVSGKVADLGAGWGYLSSQIMSNPKLSSVTLFENDAYALDCARLNIPDPRAQFHWADATHLPSFTRQFDTVIMNPPFHTDRKARPTLGQDFIRSARSVLQPKGNVWLVANTHLPYEQSLDEAFEKVEFVASENGFKILHAKRPKSKHV